MDSPCDCLETCCLLGRLPGNEEYQKVTYPGLDGDREEVCELQPHEQCDNMVYCSSWGHETLSLDILRSCRQMYIEANQVLWSTNTFSFNGGIDFKSFMETRTLIQKRTLKKLRLSMDYSLDHKEWNSALNFAVLRSLHGLRHLRLSIDFSLTSRGHVHLKNHFTGPYRTGYFETLEKIATLPLTHVEIGVTGTTYIDDKHDDVIAWSKAEKTECAESLRNLLLDPRGAEVYEQKQMEVKEMRRKLQESMAAVKAARRSWILDRVPIRDTLNGKLNQFSTIPRETKSAENT